MLTFDYRTEVNWSTKIRLYGYIPFTVSIFRHKTMHPDHVRFRDRARTSRLARNRDSGPR